MAKQRDFNFDKLIKEWQRTKSKLPRKIGTVAVNHFKKSFRDGGFTNRSLQKWKPRKHPDLNPKQRGILIQTGDLRRSIKIRMANPKRIIIGTTGVQYAEIHNRGGTVRPRVTEKSRRFAWARFKQTGNPMFKAMATTSKTNFDINIPKRQFIGRSHKLETKIFAKLVTELKRLQ